ncbi:lysophospholipid acyltransferase family protein [Chachezhania antarctica]|uniref:lysophospholipid acyltransferase family protein n=1 Tax=Chachezhania antarctica TaxID=2340860 RepID=UPI001F08AF19|nr:lysophospholipid acyltransferase family protein [Chachezhania antarctica]
MTVLRWLRSVVFTLQMFLAMGVLGVVFLPLALLSRGAARLAAMLFCRWVFLTARWLLGIRTEWRGPVPTGDVLIAAKHQSFLDVMMLFSVLPNVRFVMKKELVRTPVFGFYAMRIGCIAIDRKRGNAGMARMVRKALEDDGGQLVIYPQGTRVSPGATASYRPGVAVLYEAMDVPCVPVATNAGLVWPRSGLARYPGRAVVEFLEPIAPGLEKREILTEIETRVEAASNALMEEPHGLR